MYIFVNIYMCVYISEKDEHSGRNLEIEQYTINKNCTRPINKRNADY